MSNVITKGTAAQTPQHTHIPLPTEQRAQAIEALNRLIIDIANVSASIRHVQWNMAPLTWSQSLFQPSIEALEKQAAALSDRVHALGGFVPATARSIAHDSGIEAFPNQSMDEEAYKNAIVVRFGQLAKSARLALMKADNINEPVTSYHLTEATVVIEKHLSLFERHLVPAN